MSVFGQTTRHQPMRCPCLARYPVTTGHCMVIASERFSANTITKSIISQSVLPQIVDSSRVGTKGWVLCVNYWPVDCLRPLLKDTLGNRHGSLLLELRKLYWLRVHASAYEGLEIVICELHPPMTLLINGFGETCLKVIESRERWTGPRLVAGGILTICLKCPQPARHTVAVLTGSSKSSAVLPKEIADRKCIFLFFVCFIFLFFFSLLRREH